MARKVKGFDLIFISSVSFIVLVVFLITNRVSNPTPFVLSPLAARSTCIDSDKDNIYTKGHLTSDVSGVCKDDVGQCLDDIDDWCFPIGKYPHGYDLVEYTCKKPSRHAVVWSSNNDVYENAVECPNGCINGACIKDTASTCIDSDGGDNIYYQGVIDGPNLTTGDDPTDYCITPEILVEYSCSSAGGYYGTVVPGLYSNSINCEYGCNNGACSREPGANCTCKGGKVKTDNCSTAYIATCMDKNNCYCK